MMACGRERTVCTHVWKIDHSTHPSIKDLVPICKTGLLKFIGTVDGIGPVYRVAFVQTRDGSRSQTCVHTVESHHLYIKTFLFISQHCSSEGWFQSGPGVQ